MNRLVVLGLLAITACKGGPSKSVGKEVCPLVAAKITTCKEAFWTEMGNEPYGFDRKLYEGNEQKLCEDQFAIREAQGALFDSCVKIDDCGKFSVCAVPAFWQAKK